MAEKVEKKGFLSTVVNAAKWTAVAFLGIDALLLLGAPVVIMSSLLSWAVNGAILGGVVGGIYAGLREIGASLKPKQASAA